MSEAWEFDIANNPAAMNRQDYFRACDEFQGRSSGGHSVDAGAHARTRRLTDEELRWIAENAAEQFTRDMIDTVRRDVFRGFVVDNGLSYDEAFAKLLAQELVLMRKFQAGSASEGDRRAAAYVSHHPLREVNDFMAGYGNRWCVNLRRDVAKKQAARERAEAKRARSAAAAEAKAKRAASRVSSDSKTGQRSGVTRVVDPAFDRKFKAGCLVVGAIISVAIGMLVYMLMRSLLF